MEPVVQWLAGNWGWALSVFLVFFEIAPIKLHPITGILGWLGKKLTSGITADIAELKRDTDANYASLEERISNTEKAVDMQRIGNIRTSVLNFANSCLNKRKHTKEEFEHILAENSVYDELVEKYNIRNEVYAESYAYIKRIYQRCLDRHDFLSVPADGEE